MKLLLNRQMYTDRKLTNEALILWANHYNHVMLEGVTPIKRVDGWLMLDLALENIETDTFLIELFEQAPHYFSKGFKIIEIPDGIEYEIVEGYDDQYQLVVEKGRSW